ncbi:NnrU family protein [Rhodovulum euryhalinum]|uniref:NnrU family protein n=1 Tax=Rhodovulum euryhalinum TaxID=35805 RepID=UPI0010476F4B
MTSPGVDGVHAGSDPRSRQPLPAVRQTGPNALGRRDGKAWDAAHGVANPDLAHLIIFGLFLAVSVGAVPLCDDRSKAANPDARPKIQAATSTPSPRSLVDPSWLASCRNSIASRHAAALVVFMAVLHLQTTVIGISPPP